MLVLLVPVKTRNCTEKMVTSIRKGRGGGENCLPEGYHMSGWLKRLPWKYNYKPDLAVNSISAITDFVRVTRI